MHEALAGTGRRRMPRWLLPAAAAVVVASTATVLLIVHSAGAACAAPALTPAALAPAALAPAVPALAPAAPAPAAAAKSGKATFYAADGGGNCSFDAAGPGMYVALGPSEYAAGAACGGYLDVTGPKGTVRVKVTDQCPECPSGHLDLSREAFAKIGTPKDGIIPVTYQQVRDPTLPAALTVRIKDGASRYWFAARVDNHGNPLSSVEVRNGGGWLRLSHVDYNYWIADSGAGPGPFTLRITDTAGHQATVTGIALAPQKVQQTTVRMYGAPAPARPSSTAATPGTPSGTPAPASPSPSVEASPPPDPGAGPVAAQPAPVPPSPSPHRRCG